MARQAGAFPIIGRLDEWSFYKDKHHGLLVRHKGGPKKEQIKEKDSMEPVRHNNSEFGMSSKYGAFVRRAFRPLIVCCAEYTMSRRLQALLLSVMKMDSTKRRGSRGLVKENLVALQAFELNTHLSYQKIFKKDVDIIVSGTGITVRGRFVAPKNIAKHADYYKIVSVAAGLDFEQKTFSQEVKETKLSSCKESTDVVFEHSVERKEHLFYGLVVCFFKRNGKTIELIKDDKMKAGFISFLE